MKTEDCEHPWATQDEGGGYCQACGLPWFKVREQEKAREAATSDALQSHGVALIQNLAKPSAVERLNTTGSYRRDRTATGNGRMRGSCPIKARTEFEDDR